MAEAEKTLSVSLSRHSNPALLQAKIKIFPSPPLPPSFRVGLAWPTGWKCIFSYIHLAVTEATITSILHVFRLASVSANVNFALAIFSLRYDAQIAERMQIKSSGVCEIQFSFSLDGRHNGYLAKES